MKRKKLLNAAFKVLSTGLAILLLFITAIQASHHHAPKTFVEDISESGEYIYSTDKCTVCDYLSHQNHKEFHLPAPVILTAPVTKPVTLLSRSYAGIYKFTLQGFTNKGPPNICRATIFTL